MLNERGLTVAARYRGSWIWLTTTATAGAQPQNPQGASIFLARGIAFPSPRDSLLALETGAENILHAAVLQIRDHLQPALGTCGPGNPLAQQFLAAVQIDPNRQARRPSPHRARRANVSADAVGLEDRAQRSKRAVMPELHLLTTASVACF